MAEYIERESLIENLNQFAPEHYNALVNMLITKQPAADVVSRAAFDQVMWERDTAMEQLKEHGIPFGGEADVVAVVRCKDCRNSMLWRKPTDTVIGECLIRKMHSEDEEFCQVGADDFCSYGERRGDNG